jgi:hypothetical protein
VKRHLLFFTVFTFLAVTISAQNGIPSISWARGDTIGSLRSKNPSIRFNLTNSLGNAQQFEVKEIENPYIYTNTTLTFDESGRLSSVILSKHGTYIDVYESLITRYRSIYGNPVENNELTVRRDLTGATANVKFENNIGSVNIIFGVSMVNTNPPFIMLIESYKYNNTSSSNNNPSQQNRNMTRPNIENARKLFFIEWYNDGSLNIEKILQNGNLISSQIGEEYRTFRGRFSNSQNTWAEFKENNVTVFYTIAENNTLSSVRITYEFKTFEEADAFLVKKLNVLKMTQTRVAPQGPYRVIEGRFTEQELRQGATEGFISKMVGIEDRGRLRHVLDIGYSRADNVFRIFHEIRLNRDYRE